MQVVAVNMLSGTLDPSFILPDETPTFELLSKVI